MRYRFDTTTSLDERYALRLYELDYPPQGKQNMKRYRLSILFSVLIALAVGYILFPNTWDFLAYSICPAIALGIWQLLAKTIMRRNRLRQLRQEEKFFGSGASETFFYEDGFSSISEDVKYDVQYRCVKKAVLYKNSIFFLITKRMVFMVPCRALAGQATVAEFADFLRSRGITVEIVE